jgi:2-dehydro-3-deoxyglucarate aldolase/4-hydroxy-2-oxoheptanedioate aldolase
MNTLREKLKKQKIAGTLVCLSDPCLCEIMGNIGYDCVWIDLEHTYISYKDVLCHLNAARSAEISSVVRLPQNDLTATKKILEMGPDGVIFPMVRSLEEFNSLVQMTLYPPLGTRGFGPMRAIGYDADRAKEYVYRDNFDMCRLVQIEHVSMIDELEEIAKNPYIDGFIFGPNDLSGTIGEFLDVFGNATASEIKRAIEILRRNNKYIGVACGFGENTLKYWMELGFDMVFAGADWNFVYECGRKTLETIKKFQK